MASPKYTSDQREFIKELWDAEEATSEIAARVNLKYGLGISRLAIIGLARRLGFDARTTGGKYSEDGHRKRVATMSEKGIAFGRTPYKHYSKPRLSPKPEEKIAATDVNNAGSLEPEPLGLAGEFGDGCKWISGDTRSRDWKVCGHPAEGNYCLHHKARAYNKPYPAKS